MICLSGVPRRLRMRSPQWGSASDCLAVSGTRAMWGIGDILLIVCSHRIMPILALCSDTPKEVQGQLTAEMREGILEQLPATVQMIAAYWRAPNLGFPRRELLRSTKVGRNEPCPCGSGKKFKKCCGSGASPLVH